jgi:hypothetical protein
MMRCAAIAMVCSPLEQKRLTVAPLTVTDLARDVHAGRALGVGAAHQHVLDRAAVDAGALDRGLDRETAQRRAMGHVEGALPALGQGGAGGGDDDGIAHDGELLCGNGGRRLRPAGR